MIIKDPKFEISAVSPAQYPKNSLPQIVLVGKSNVGKSSFIKTRQINFYNIDNNFYFVDLPGYGYSKMSKQEQTKVGNFIEEYLSTSKNISLIIFLIDIRHSPTENDKLMYNYIINCNLPCLIIANKADKIAITKVNSEVEHLQNELNPLKDLTFLPFSSERRIYEESVWNYLSSYIENV